jgi:hypothetical protein
MIGHRNDEGDREKGHIFSGTQLSRSCGRHRKNLDLRPAQVSRFPQPGTHQSGASAFQVKTLKKFGREHRLLMRTFASKVENIQVSS